MDINKIHNEDCLPGLKKIPDNLIDCCISSPPYWGLRDYEVDGQLGNEKTFIEFIGKLIEIYKEVHRVLKPAGTCFVNLGDTYSGSGNGSLDKNAVKRYNGKGHVNNKPIPKTKIKNKSLLMIPERFSISMIDNGWILRNQIIWHKPNQMPQSAKDKFTNDFEKIFFFVKTTKDYYFEQQFLESISKDNSLRDRDNTRLNNTQGREKMSGLKHNSYDLVNMRTVWSINTKPFSEAHFAVFPEKLIERMIKAGCPENGVILDPFMGSGTTAVVARKLNRNYIGYELNQKYIDIANKRLYKELGMFI